MDGRGTITRRERDVLAVVWLSGHDGALLAGATRPELGQVESRAARALERAGMLTIDAGGVARLTDQGSALMA